MNLRSPFRPLRRLGATTLILAFGAAVSAPAQTRVDLRAAQSAFSDQGGRDNCITFSVIAAMEAAYWRAGYGTLDLSEEFGSFMATWALGLHPNWDDSDKYENNWRYKGVRYSENYIGVLGGGSGRGVLDILSHNRVPEEPYMPYRLSGYGLSPALDDPAWNDQRTLDSFNLDPHNLPRSALLAPRYFGIQSYETLSNARDTDAIEAVLRSGKEVIFDCTLGGNRDSGTIWQPDPTKPIDGAHSMLIVGYDRTSSDPKQHHFIVKNSWGGRTLPRGAGTMPDGFTHISYDYLRTHGSFAGYITAVQRPSAWEELGFLGRWNFSYDGTAGLLDIYHLPGSGTHFFNDAPSWPFVDRRLGTFFADDGSVYRVNGNVVGRRIEFWFDTTEPHMKWTKERTPGQKRFVFYMINPQTGEMAGNFERNPDTTAATPRGGYARVASSILARDGFLSGMPRHGGGTPEQYLGEWHLRFAPTEGRLLVRTRDDSLVDASVRHLFAGLRCRFIQDGTGRAHELVALVNKQTNGLTCTLSHSFGSTVFTAYGFTWQTGVLAGTGTWGSRGTGIYGRRLGDLPIVYLGLGAKLQNGVRMRHDVVGQPILGGKLELTLENAPEQSGVALILGDKAFPDGFRREDLLPECLLYTVSQEYLWLNTDAKGRASRVLELPNTKEALGQHVVSQFLVPLGNGNATSNGCDTTIGEGD
ncbi:MAG: hypothetical protein KDC87_02215 [Planctomycetes bacterium]|nr:hypothetical protein [Planctomycetota bacterium]